MGDDGVKGVRRDGRRERSVRTSVRLVAEARTLFVSNGYMATSVEAVAERAGVSPQAVYNRFGSKSQLLVAVLDRAVAGDDEPRSVVDRSWLDTADDAPTAVRRFARMGAAIVAQAAPVYDVVRSASSVVELTYVLADNRRRRRADQRLLLDELAAAGHLRAGIDIAAAADTVYALMNEDVCLMLMGDCGWTEDRLATWLGDLLVRELT